MNTSQKSAGLKSIVGEPVSGVAFVQDYVEFHFDGKILRMLTNPLVTIKGEGVRFPAAGSRDALCSLIGRTVDAIAEDEEKIDLRLSGQATLSVLLGEDERTGPEAVHFVPGPNQPIDVW